MLILRMLKAHILQLRWQNLNIWESRWNHDQDYHWTKSSAVVIIIIRRLRYNTISIYYLISRNIRLQTTQETTEYKEYSYNSQTIVTPLRLPVDSFSPKTLGLLRLEADMYRSHGLRHAHHPPRKP
jgi:hypothetical protein